MPGCASSFCWWTGSAGRADATSLTIETAGAEGRRCPGVGRRGMASQLLALALITASLAACSDRPSPSSREVPVSREAAKRRCLSSVILQLRRDAKTGSSILIARSTVPGPRLGPHDGPAPRDDLSLVRQQVFARASEADSSAWEDLLAARAERKNLEEGEATRSDESFLSDVEVSTYLFGDLERGARELRRRHPRASAILLVSGCGLSSSGTRAMIYVEEYTPDGSGYGSAGHLFLMELRGDTWIRVDQLPLWMS